MKIRLPTTNEIKAVSSIAPKLPIQERTQLIADLESATVNTDNSTSNRVLFILKDYERPKYQGQHAYRAEGRLLDADSVQLDMIVYADENHRLLELEFIRWGNRALIKPNWETLKII